MPNPLDPQVQLGLPSVEYRAYWVCVWFGFTLSARFRKECHLMSTVPFLPSSGQARLFPGWGTEASETLPVHILLFTTSGKTTNQPERPTNPFPLGAEET